VTSITVNTEDFRKALKAVAPHSSSDLDLPTFNRVRLAVGADEVTVSASQGYTIGRAVVEVVDNHDGQIETVDLTPQDAKEILALFKPGRDLEGSSTLRLDVTDGHFEVTDTGGLFDGKALSLPRTPTDPNFPDLSKLLVAAITGRGEGQAPLLVASGEYLGMFGHAARAYNELLAVQPTAASATLLILCGSRFVGLLSTSDPGADRLLEIDDWHGSWLDRLSEPVA